MSASAGDSVLFEEVNNNGLIILNRPKALNSINYEMVHSVYSKLRPWESEKNLVIIKGAGEKAFCAGGDVRSVVENGPAAGAIFFRCEYTNNALIADYKKPYVAIIDGITMGGGVGLSVHGKYRVATERTLFAMPETAIGLFPDVGGSYFLPRLPGKLGLFLGLTGFRLRGQDVFKVGVATHYVPSSRIPDLEKELLASNGSNVEEILAKYHSLESQPFILEPHLALINKCFSANKVEEILRHLREDGSEFAKNTLGLLAKMSPTSMKVTKRLLDLGKDLDLKECLKIEFRLAVHHTQGSDFQEGVRALLIDKDQKPNWNPRTLEEVTHHHVDSFFDKLADVDELKFDGTSKL